jgi:hypothetical protein
LVCLGTRILCTLDLPTDLIRAIHTTRAGLSSPLLHSAIIFHLTVCQDEFYSHMQIYKPSRVPCKFINLLKFPTTFHSVLYPMSYAYSLPYPNTQKARTVFFFEKYVLGSFALSSDNNYCYGTVLHCYGRLCFFFKFIRCFFIMFLIFIFC